MSALPPYRQPKGSAYKKSSLRDSGPPNNRDKDTLSVTPKDDPTKKGQQSPRSGSPRNRSTSIGNIHEGLVFDRSPEETERISKQYSYLLDGKKPASTSILGAIKHKMQSDSKKTGHHSHAQTVPTTTIITRHAGDAAVSDHVQHGGDSKTDSQDGDKQQDHLPLDMYSFVIDDPEKSYSQFMQAHLCYDVIPTNAKLVILDTNLDVRKAFHALVFNSVRSALLWNSKKQHLCGMLTITDFILILLRLYRTDKTAIGTNLETHLIREWRDVLKKEGKLKKLYTITGSTSLYRAVQVLTETRYHRIPVLDETNGNPLYFLTHKRILRFLYLYLEQLPRPSFMHGSVQELNVGTFRDLQFVHPDTPLVECLTILTNRHMSAVPVVERRTLKVVDIYARFDAIGLAAQQSYDRLDETVAEALQHRKSSNWYEGVLTCMETDKLWDVVQKLVLHEVHGLVVVNNDNALRGVITLSDVLKFLVLNPIMESENEDMPL